ncbi:MAG: cupin domain-containing protein [Candidatus Bathyarchaeia archaeon]
MVHPQTTGSKNLSAFVLYLGPGGVTEPHDHENEELYVILKGGGEGYFGQGKIVKVEPGMFVHMPAHAEHGLKNTGDRMLVVLV